MVKHIQHDTNQKKNTSEMCYSYSLAALQNTIKNQPDFAENQMKDYLLNDLKHEEHPGVWCTSCRFKGLCKKPYTRDN